MNAMKHPTTVRLIIFRLLLLSPPVIESKDRRR
jgi:hypothetical protein